MQVGDLVWVKGRISHLDGPAHAPECVFVEFDMDVPPGEQSPIASETFVRKQDISATTDRCLA